MSFVWQNFKYILLHPLILTLLDPLVAVERDKGRPLCLSCNEAGHTTISCKINKERNSETSKLQDLFK